jgi:hypothetical protein
MSKCPDCAKKSVEAARRHTQRRIAANQCLCCQDPPLLGKRQKAEDQARLELDGYPHGLAGVAGQKAIPPVERCVPIHEIGAICYEVLR